MQRVKFRRAAVAAGLLGAGLCGLTGCKTAAKDIGAAAAPAAVQAGLKEANAPDVQQQIHALIESDAFQKAGRSVGEGVGVGLFQQANQLAGLTPAGTQPATQPGTQTDPNATRPSTGPAGAAAAASPGASAVAGLATGGTGLNGLVQSSVQTAFLAAVDPKFKEGERAMSEAIGEGILQGMMTVLDKEGPHLGKTIQTQLGPIFQSLIHDQIAPAIADTVQNQLAPVALDVWKKGAVETVKLSVRPDMQPDVIKNAENASIGASRGTTQQLVQAGVLSENGGFSPRVKTYAWVAVGGIGLIGLALLTLLLLLNVLVLRYLLTRRPAERD